LRDLEALVESGSRGDPESLLRWTSKSVRHLAAGLREQGHSVHFTTVAKLLRLLGYSLQANVKSREGASHPDRDAQFERINAVATAAVAAGVPVISVDTKKKELIGDCKNPGQAWGATPELVNVHDFPGDAVGRAVPYGIYDAWRNVGVVYVGQSADTPEFAVDAIAAWCADELPVAYPGARQLLIEADGGGSNSARSRVWKAHLQAQVADRFGLTVTVCHYPPGTSKWNPIEHRLFSAISKTWAGCPLRTFERLLEYLRATQTTTGLRVQAALLPQIYRTGVQIADAIMAGLHIQAQEGCPAWNYTIHPRLLAPAI